MKRRERRAGEGKSIGARTKHKENPAARPRKGDRGKLTAVAGDHTGKGKWRPSSVSRERPFAPSARRGEDESSVSRGKERGKAAFKRGRGKEIYPGEADRLSRRTLVRQRGREIFARRPIVKLLEKGGGGLLSAIEEGTLICYALATLIFTT